MAPASVREGDPSSTVSVSWKNIRKDLLSNKQVTQFSTDGRNLAGEVDRILKECEDTQDVKRGFPKSPLYMCKNYTFCYNQRDQHDTDVESTHTADIILPTDLLKPGRFEDKKDICTFNKLNMPRKQVIFKFVFMI